MEINENNLNLNNENDYMYLFSYFRNEIEKIPKNDDGISKLYDKINVKKYISK